MNPFERTIRIQSKAIPGRSGRRLEGRRHQRALRVGKTCTGLRNRLVIPMEFCRLRVIVCLNSA